MLSKIINTLTLFVLCAEAVLISPTAVFEDNLFCTSREECRVYKGSWCLGFFQFEDIVGTALAECKHVSGEFPCMCRRPPHTCSTSLGCSRGYRCVHSPLLADRPTCVHCTYVDVLTKMGTKTMISEFLLVDDGPQCTPSATPRNTQAHAPVKEKAKKGHTWMKCQSDRDCAKGRRCLRSRFSSLHEPCQAEQKKWCVCRPYEKSYYCSRSSDCLPGDRCVTYIIDIPLEQRHICVACDYVKHAVDVVPMDGIETCHLD